MLEYVRIDVPPVFLPQLYHPRIHRFLIRAGAGVGGVGEDFVLHLLGLDHDGLGLVEGGGVVGLLLDLQQDCGLMFHMFDGVPERIGVLRDLVVVVFISGRSSVELTQKLIG